MDTTAPPAYVLSAEEGEMKMAVFSVASKLRPCICLVIIVKSVFSLELMLVPMGALQQCPLSSWFIRAEPI